MRPVAPMIQQRSSADDDELRIGMDGQGLLERLENADAVLALLNATDREQDGIAIQAVFGPQLTVERAADIGEAARIDTVSDRGRSAAQIGPDPFAPKFAHDQQFIRPSDPARLPVSEAR